MIQDFLSDYYLWTKSLHVISVIAWMAGIFYLPRLFVYHVSHVGFEGSHHDLFCMMERRLLRAIMNPSMIAVWIFGLCLVFTPGIVDWSEWWSWLKAVSVLGMTWFHHWLAKERKLLSEGKSVVTSKRFRAMNEVPTVLMVVIVIMVIARPF